MSALSIEGEQCWKPWATIDFICSRSSTSQHGADGLYLLSQSALKWMNCFWPWAGLAAAQQVDRSAGVSNSSGISAPNFTALHRHLLYKLGLCIQAQWKLSGHMIACYKYIKKRRRDGGMTLGLEKKNKLGDNTGTKSNRYKLVTNRFRLKLEDSFKSSEQWDSRRLSKKRKRAKSLITFKIRFKYLWKGYMTLLPEGTG